MKDSEAIEMMKRARDEIRELRRQVDRLMPKAEAYDSLVVLIGMFPGQSSTMSVDVAAMLDRRIRELEEAPPSPEYVEAMKAAEGGE